MDILRQVVLVHAHDADPETCASRLARAAGAALETLLADPQIRIQPHILRRGDAALYEAKGQGRNRVCVEA